MTDKGPPEHDPTTDAAARAERRDKAGRDDAEPSLGRRFAQIGVLGWITVGPVLFGIFGGGWLDRQFGTGITLAAALTIVGAALGLWLAIRWMHDQ